MEIKKCLFRGKKAYFLGLSMQRNELEEFFDELFSECEKYYITKDKEIGENRKDLDGNCVICDITTFKFSENSIVFVPIGSAWGEVFLLPWKRYSTFSEKILSNGAEVVFSYIEEDAKRWGYSIEKFLTEIKNEFRKRGYKHGGINELQYNSKTLLYISNGLKYQKI